jgi:hypothetical protein
MAFHGTRAEWQRAPRDVDQRLFAWNVEAIPIEWAMKMREYDRMRHGEGAVSNVEYLTDSIRRFGFRKALSITYCLDLEDAYFGEGNHRIAAAYRLGMREVPARVWRNTECYGNAQADFPHVAVPSPFERRDGYVPADLRPSDIGIPARPLTDEERRSGILAP